MFIGIFVAAVLVLVVLLYIWDLFLRGAADSPGMGLLCSRKKLVVTEETSSNWSYHLSYEDNKFKSICGKDVFFTRVPPEYFWDILGKKTERPEDGRACPQCADLLD